LSAPPPLVNSGSAIFKDQDWTIVADIFDSDHPQCGFLLGHYGKLPTYKVLPFRSVGGESRLIYHEALILGFDEASSHSGERKVLAATDGDALCQWLVSASTQQQYGRR
jgi:hypothetical protein